MIPQGSELTMELDEVALGVPDVPAARRFYTAAFSSDAAGLGDHVGIDLHGAGRLSLHDVAALAAGAGAGPATSGFRGYVMSYVVDQPSEVEAVLAAAVAGGATVLKPAKKALFAGFTAVFRAPDGAVWKLAAATRKDTGPAGQPPRPTEVGALLGVAEPKASAAFYAALGMTVDRDYGSKYVDFRLPAGSFRLGLMPRKALAKDAGVDDDGAGFRAVVLDRRAGSRAEVDALLAAAVAAGGRLAVAAAEAEGGCAGYLADPDGFVWRVAAG